MHLYDVPLMFVLAGLALYVVLGGADFGAGAWQLAAGRGEHGARIRDHAHNSMAPVWEANHVWLIFVLTVLWTAYPRAFGSIASTLCVALFLAAIGIILRGAAYALRSGTVSMREQRTIDTLSAVSSIITPFALGAAVGGIASLRVPVGNAAGDLFSSWLNPTSVMVGALGVIAGAYLAAVFLAGDAVRRGEPDLAEDFRRRALGAGVVAGALAVAGLLVVHGDAPRLYRGLTSGDGLPAVIVSALAGVGTLTLVWARRYEAARYTAALAVAAIVAGWALVQRPIILPGLTIRQAAAPHDTLVAVIVAVLAGAVILFPSLALLFRLTLAGQLGHGAEHEPPKPAARVAPQPPAPTGLLGRLALACLIAGFGLLTVAGAGWAHALGLVALAAFVVLGVAAVRPGDLAAADEDGGDRRSDPVRSG